MADDYEVLRGKIHDLRGELQTIANRLGLHGEQFLSQTAKLDEIETQLIELATWRAGFVERMSADNKLIHNTLRAIQIQNNDRSKLQVRMANKVEMMSAEFVGLKTKLSVYVGLVVFVVTFGKEIVLALVAK